MQRTGVTNTDHHKNVAFIQHAIRPNKLNSQFIVTTSSKIHAGRAVIIHYSLLVVYCIVKLTMTGCYYLSITLFVLSSIQNGTKLSLASTDQH